MTNLYHISENFSNSLSLTPRIPNNFMTRNGYEDNITKRICLSTTINGCLAGLSKNIKNKQFHVYSIRTDKYIIPTIQQVPDSKITNEVWITHPINVNYLYTIKVGEPINKPLKYMYGNNKVANLFMWNYEIIYKNKISNLHKVLFI